jgi:hypothetical protein
LAANVEQALSFKGLLFQKVSADVFTALVCLQKNESKMFAQILQPLPLSVRSLHGLKKFRTHWKHRLESKIGRKKVKVNAQECVHWLFRERGREREREGERERERESEKEREREMGVRIALIGWRAGIRRKEEELDQLCTKTRMEKV